MDILNLFYIHGECDRIVDRTCRVFNERYPHLTPMTKKTFRRMETNFIQFGNVKSTRPRAKPVTDEEANEINVLAYFSPHVNPYGSIRSAVRDLNLSYYTVQKILSKHKMHDYSLTTVQNLHPGDNERRMEFCEQMLVKLQEDPQFLKKIIWTDESKFSREGIVNRKNCHYWASENPHLNRRAHFQVNFSFNVFCLIMDDRFLFHIFEGNLNSDRYLEILRGIVTNFLDDLPLNNLQNWYQMDGAPAHSTYAVHRQLTNMFEDRWIGRNGPWRWPARSPDLTPLDFFLWGYIKNEVYASPVHTREELELRVTTAFRRLNPRHIHNACTRGVHSRILKCLQQNGGYFEHL